MLWNKTFQMAGGAIVATVQQTTDDGFIIGGNYIPPGGLNNKLYLVRTNSFGDTLWTSAYGGAGLDDIGWAQQTYDGGFIQCGRTENFGGNANGDAYMIKTTPAGSISWSYRYGGNQPEQFSSVQQTSDHGYITGGNSGSFGAGYLYVVKTDSSGLSNCSQNATPTVQYHPAVTIGTTALTNSPANSWVTIPSIVISGIDTTVHTICLTTTSINEIKNNNSKVSVYPIPATNQVNIKTTTISTTARQYVLTNALGQKMAEGILSSDNENTTLNVESFPSGVYFLIIFSKDSTERLQISKL